MKMDLQVYLDKVHGCWLGKNIGGTLGAPFECRRGVFDIDFYTHDLTTGVLPNDDLDLQLIWLHAAEEYGKTVDAKILGEYWLSYIVPNWCEYGAAKNNMALGIAPPLSGWYHNHNKDSCGAFIRSELWACLAPGHPDIAVKYAYEDAIVDHSDEGVYGELFCAAIQSAAFSVSDTDTLVSIGLSYIPEDCAVAKAVIEARRCYAEGLTWQEARKKILQLVPGTFGQYIGYEDREPESDVPLGKPGFDTPSNIGILMIGWLYSEGDIGKGVCIAAGCGEDADCTAATLGAVLGIIQGADALPEKWLAPIGDEIKTICIDLTDSSLKIPASAKELTERICSLMPTFMLGNVSLKTNPGSVTLELLEGDALFAVKDERYGHFSTYSLSDRIKRQPTGITAENTIIDIFVDCIDGIDIAPEKELRFNVQIINKIKKQQWLKIRFILPEEISVSTGTEFMINMDQKHGGFGIEEFAFTLLPQAVLQAKYTVIMEVTLTGRHSALYLPIPLLNNPQVKRL